MHLLQLVSPSLLWFIVFFSVFLQGLDTYLFLLSFSFFRWSTGTTKSTIRQVLFFGWLSSHLAEIRWSICISKSLRIFCVWFSRTDSEFCIFRLFVWSNLNFLLNLQWITFPTQSCLVLYSFWANLLAFLIIWLIVSSLLLLLSFKPYQFINLTSYPRLVRGATWVVIINVCIQCCRIFFCVYKLVSREIIRGIIFRIWGVANCTGLPEHVTIFM